MILVYTALVFTARQRRLQAKQFARMQPFVRGARLVLEFLWAPCVLLVYYYDFMTSIIVLVQIWSYWPADILTVIFFLHFTLVGGVVAFHGIRRWLGCTMMKSAVKCVGMFS